MKGWKAPLPALLSMAKASCANGNQASDRSKQPGPPAVLAR